MINCLRYLGLFMGNFLNKYKTYLTTFGLIIATLIVGLFNYAVYDVEINLNGGRLDNNTNVNTFISPRGYLDQSPTRSGYSIDGWYVNNTTKLEDYNNLLREDIVLTARWKLSQIRVSFNTNGGSSVGSINANVNSTITLPSSTRSGYSFVGWRLTTSTSGQLYLPGATYSITGTEPITFYAFWQQVINVTITLNPNSGTVSPSTLTGTSGSNLNLPTPTRAGYVFDGWYSSSSFTLSSRVTYTVFPNSNVTLWAKWLLGGVSFLSALPLTLNSVESVVISTSNQEVYYKFTPTLSGSYVFSSSGSRDTIGYLYSSTQTLITEADSGGTSLNFSISRSLTANTLYYLKVRIKATGTGSFTITVTR